MTNKEIAQYYHNLGLRIIPLHADRTPYIEPFDLAKIKSLERSHLDYSFNYTHGLGILTGWHNTKGLYLFVIDFDVKYESEPKNNFGLFIGKLIDLGLMDYIQNTYVVQTKSEGFHVYFYASIEVPKIVLSRNEKEQPTIEIISNGIQITSAETPKYKVFNNAPEDIQTLPNDVLTSILEVAKSFCKAPIKEKPQPKPKKEYKQKDFGTSESPFEAFNKNNPIDYILNFGYKIKKENATKYELINPNSKSKTLHATLTFVNDTWLFHSFSTNSLPFESDKSYNPCQVFALINGIDYDNKKELGQRLAAEGFGTWNESKKKEPIYTYEIPKQETQKNQTKDPITAFPLHIFPTELQEFIECFAKKADVCKAFLGASILSTFAGVVGLSKKLRLANGWEATPSLFSVLIGSSSSGKSEAMKYAIKPILQIESDYKKEYDLKVKEYEEHEKNLKKGQKNELEQPKRKEVLLNSATIESVAVVHQNNPNGVLSYQDELVGWLKSFNQYKSGADQQIWLSIWDNGMIKNTRKTTTEQFIKESCVTLLGGIQNGVVHELASGNMRNDGFLYRFLFTFQEPKEILRWNDMKKIHSEMSLQDNYNHHIKQLAKETNDKKVYHLDNAADNVWGNHYDLEKEKQENETDENKSFMIKLSKYTTRLALILQIITDCYDGVMDNVFISAQTMQNAIELAKYFKYTMFKALNTIDENNDFKSNKPITRGVDFLKMFGGKETLTTAEITKYCMENHQMSRASAYRLIESELKKVSHGVYSL